MAAVAVGRPDTAKKLLDDMRREARICRDTGEVRPVAKPLLREFAERARRGLPGFQFWQSVEVFYWLAKCAHGAGEELDDELLLAYTEHVRSEALTATETKLVKILRTFLDVLNRNKIASSMDTDAQRRMEAVAQELLAAALPRLCARHRHLPFLELSVLLSAYVKMFRPEYLQLFEAVAPNVVARHFSEASPWSLAQEVEFFQHSPFIIMAYAQARCAHPLVFNSYMGRLEARLEDLTYENVAVLAYSISIVGLDRPKLWSGIEKQIGAGQAKWPMRAVGRIAASCRRMLMLGREHAACHGSHSVILRLLRTAGRVMLQRRESVQFHEAADVAMALAALPADRGDTADDTLAEEEAEALLRLACEVIERSPAAFPPSYLSSGFHALVALLLLRLQGGAEAEEEHLLGGVRALAKELGLRMHLCLVADMGPMSEALWALLGRAPPALAWQLGADRMLLVQQREAVRKAHELGLPAAVRIARLTAEAVAAIAERGEPAPARVAGHRGLLRPWFLPELLDYSQRAEDAQRLEPERLAWLSAAAAAGEAGLGACALAHAWPRLAASGTGPSLGSAVGFAYGGCPA